MHEIVSVHKMSGESKRQSCRTDSFTFGPVVDVHSPDRENGILFRKASCACGGGCPACQAKSSDLNISQPNDPAEIEADHIADKVMRTPVADGKPANTVSDPNTIHRKCSSCDEEKDKIQRKPLPGNNGIPFKSPAHVERAISSGGQPLDHQTRSFFEPRMGYDLSSVRIHTDSTAGQSARALNAKAYTLGANIVFGHGAFRPETETGRHLLAHELAHATQQGAVAQTIRRAPDECPDPIPNSWQLYGGSESLARRGLFIGGKPDPTTLSGLSSIGIRAIPGLPDRFRSEKISPDTTQTMDPRECAAGLGVRLGYPPGNALGLEAVELCQEGELVKFKFFCGSQMAEKNCSQMSTPELLSSGRLNQASVESKMREFLAAAERVADKMDVIAIALACDPEENQFYYQAASSNPGKVPRAVLDLAAARGIEATYSDQTKLASDLVRSAEGKARLQEVFGADADQILADLESRDTPTKEAAQLKVYEAFKEYPNLHAEREAIYAIEDKGDRPIFVMPSKAACAVCQQFISGQQVILLAR